MGVLRRLSVALICCRRDIPEAEWLPVLLGLTMTCRFFDEAQKIKFLNLWQQRYAEVKVSLDTEIKALDESSAYAPEVMDVRGAIASLPPKSAPKLTAKKFLPLRKCGPWASCLPSKTGPMNGLPPKTKKRRSGTTPPWKAIVALTEDDTDEPTLSALSEDGPLSVSESRLNAYGEACGLCMTCEKFGAALAA
jgi:uncharacterized protein